MSALAEALVAAQRRALSAMEKMYAAGKLSDDTAIGIMETIGCTDGVDQDRLLAALAVIRDYGAALPSEPRGNGASSSEAAGTENATDAQLALIARLVKDKQLVGPDLPITKAQAHEVIDTLKAGTYDASAWKVPF